MQRCRTLVWMQYVHGYTLHLTPYTQPKLMGCIQRRYEAMTKESPVPTLKADLEISSALLISSAGLGAGAFLHSRSLSLCIQKTAGRSRLSLVPSFILLQPPSCRCFLSNKGLMHRFCIPLFGGVSTLATLHPSKGDL